MLLKLANNGLKAQKIGDIATTTMQIENVESSLGYQPTEKDANASTCGFVTVNGGEPTGITLVHNGDTWDAGLADATDVVEEEI